MPDLTLMVWNIETFGDARDAARGITYAPVYEFIGRAVCEAQTDIFFMMELRRNGQLWLSNIKDVLDILDPQYVWQYDYIPGAVLPGNPYPINGPMQLGYPVTAHSEGYAVFWRSNNPIFSMLDLRPQLSHNPINGQSHISLVFEGRNAVFNDAEGWFNAPNFDPANPPAAWPQLDFPVPDPIHGGDKRWDYARRPAYCVLNIPGRIERAKQLLPIVVYHAPFSHNSTRFGVQLSGYSSVLYQVDDTAQPARTMINIDQAIMAGDFNLDWNDRLNDDDVQAYLTFLNAYASGAGGNHGGANLSAQWVSSTNNPTQNRSAIRLSDDDGVVINSANSNDYRWLAIDNIFYRNVVEIPPVLPAANYHGYVWNMVADLMTGGVMVDTAPKRRCIRGFAEAMDLQMETGEYTYINPSNGTPCKSHKRELDGTEKYPGPLIADLLNYYVYRADVRGGHFTNARRAAEFYKNCISDHLPVVFRFTV